MISKKIINFNNDFPSILFALIPLSLVAGPFIAEINIFLLILTAFFLKIFKFENSDIKKFTLFFFIFYISINISSFFSPNITLSLKSSFAYIRFYIFILIIYFLIISNKKTLNYLKQVLIFIFILFFIDSNFQLYLGKNILGYELLRPNDQLRVSSFFKDELIMGSFIVRFLPILLGLILLTKCNSLKKNIYFLSTLSISTYLVLLSGERLAVLYLSIIYLIFFLFVNFNKYTKILLLSLVLITGVLILNYYPNLRIIQATKKQITNFQQIEDKYINQKKFLIMSDQHYAHFTTAYKIFIDNPIFGKGIKSFRFICNDPRYHSNKKKIMSEYGNYSNIESCSTHPHNTYIQLLSETGILPASLIFLIFLVSIFQIIKISIKSYSLQDDLKNKANFQIFIFTAIIINFFPVLPSGNFYNNWLSIIYSIPLGLFLSTMSNFKIKK